MHQMRFKPKKRLGQNFLVERSIREKIVLALDLKKEDVVLEIGSGKGELTSLLAEKAKCVYALEIDAELCGHLLDLARLRPNIKVVHRDILGLNLKNYFCGTKKKIRVAGNIPYYISTPIITHLFHYRKQIRDIFMTVQKEFAHRLAASPGSPDYSSLSCFVQYYAECQILFSIKKGSFFPVPKVDSSFIRLRIRRTPLVHPRNEKLFFKIIRAAFNQRRKTLRNSLEGILSREQLERYFEANGLDRNARPETLSLEDFSRLAKIS